MLLSCYRSADWTATFSCFCSRPVLPADRFRPYGKCVPGTCSSGKYSRRLLFSAKEKAPDRKNPFCQGRVIWNTDTRGATLLLRLYYHTLTGIPSYSWQLTYAFTSWNTRQMPFPMPSAVHLKLRFLPGSHLPGLSVSALVTLSPLQRFLSLWTCYALYADFSVLSMVFSFFDF